MEVYNLSTTILKFTTYGDVFFSIMDHTSIEHCSHAACVVTVESGSTLPMFNVIMSDPRNRMTLTDISYLAVTSTEATLQCQKISVWNLGREALAVQDK